MFSPTETKGAGKTDAKESRFPSSTLLSLWGLLITTKKERKGILNDKGLFRNRGVECIDLGSTEPAIPNFYKGRSFGHQLQYLNSRILAMGLGFIGFRL